MRIAHLIAQFYPYVGGAEICVHNVCRTLSAKGHKAVVITTTPEPHPSPNLPYENIHLWSRTSGLLKKTGFMGQIYLNRKLTQLQKKYSFDLWQVTGGYPLGIYAVDFFRKNNIPCILRCCGEDIQKFSQINYGYRLDPGIDSLAKEKYPLYKGLIALTPTVKQEYTELGIPEEKIEIIPNGADFLKFKKNLEDKNKLLKIREKFNVENRKLILTTGRYHPKKGFDQIPDIAKKIKDKGIDFVWIVAGNGTKEILKKFPESEKLGIICSEDFSKTDGEVFNLPPQSLIELYCAADIYVLPTLIETFGMVLVEAMAAGLPIVTTDAPGVKDVIEGNKNGIKAKTADIDDIANEIHKVICDPELSGKLSSNALNSAQNTYDWEVVTSRYLDFYKSIAQK